MNKSTMNEIIFNKIPKNFILSHEEEYHKLIEDLVLKFSNLHMPVCKAEVLQWFNDNVEEVIFVNDVCTLSGKLYSDSSNSLSSVSNYNSSTMVHIDGGKVVVLWTKALNSDATSGLGCKVVYSQSNGNTFTNKVTIPINMGLGVNGRLPLPSGGYIAFSIASNIKSQSLAFIIKLDNTNLSNQPSTLELGQNEDILE